MSPQRFFSFLCILHLIAMVGNVPAAESPIPLWPNGAPGAKGTDTEDIPTLTPFLAPPEKSIGGAIVVCPGGGYRGLADHEGKPVAEWLNSIGISGFVLKYRHAPNYQHPIPLGDAQRAIRTIRARAAEWKIDPHKVGILGFSAGGHLTTTAGTHFDSGDPNAADPIDRQSCRPDLIIPIYPVVTMQGEFAHMGSRKNLLGDNPSQALVDLLSNEKQVTKDTPPAFLVHGVDDAVVPVENSLMFTAALRKAGVPYELHLYEIGRHGFGMGDFFNDQHVPWGASCADWLRKHGFAK